MRLISTIALLVVLVACYGCTTSKRSHSSVDSLCRHLATNRDKIVRDWTTSPESWSDGTIIEVSDVLPEHLSPFIAEVAHRTDLKTFLAELQASLQTDFHPAVIVENPNVDGLIEIVCTSPHIRVLAEPRYVAYLQYRYPKADVMVSGSEKPILWVHWLHIHASLMPVKPD